MKKLIAIFALALSAIAATAEMPAKGYRGFVDWSNDIYNSAFYTGLTTTHGYQLNSMFFVGAGVGFEKYTEADSWIVPLYADGRADFNFGGFTPFLDLRLGGNLSEGGGVFFSPTIGYRYNWGRKVGINFGLGMSVVGYTTEWYSLNYSGGAFSISKYKNAHDSFCSFSFRLGIDF